MTCLLDPTGASVQASDADSTCADGELVSSFRDGEQRAFESLHRRHGAAVRAYVARRLGSAHDVDDVVQDVFVRAVVGLRRGDQRLDSLRPWLLRIAHNRLIDTWRAERPTEQLPGSMRAAHEPIDVLQLRAELEATLVALRALPSHQRRALVLNAVHGESYVSVAEALQVTPSAAKSLAHRGRHRVRQARTSGWRSAA